MVIDIQDVAYISARREPMQKIIQGNA